MLFIFFTNVILVYMYANAEDKEKLHFMFFVKSLKLQCDLIYINYHRCYSYMYNDI